MTLSELLSVVGLAVSFVELAATIRPGRRAMLFASGAVLALLSAVTLYASLAHRREVNDARFAMLEAFDDEPRTYDELRQELYEVGGRVFDAALEEGRRAGEIGFRVLEVRSPTGEVHQVRGYFRTLEHAGG